MRTELYWIPGPWAGRLAIMPRPRGGDWLEEEIQSWRRAGVHVVVSLLTPEEELDLNLPEEAFLCQANGIDYVSFPIVDRGVPSSFDAFSEQITRLAEPLSDGKTIAVHCRQGIGRAAMVAICLLTHFGMKPEAAMARVGEARGCIVPETAEQRGWIMAFAKALIPGSAKF